ncbi:MAG: hypothetical protein Q4P05_05630 [Actinomycetaceae bacterium]|nr:hypothetical protein [Actinomycetaceae bacterium]
MKPSDFLAAPRGRFFALRYAMECAEKDGIYLPNMVADPSVLDMVKPRPLTPSFARDILADTTGMAEYWTQPSDLDRLALMPQIQNCLKRFATVASQASATSWWDDGVAFDQQWKVEWEVSNSRYEGEHPREILRREQVDSQQLEIQEEQEFTGNFDVPRSGAWWSTPPAGLTQSTRELWDGTCAGMWWIEDSSEDLAVDSRPLAINTNNVYEIHSPHAWKYLCETYPRTVTAQKRYDWYRVTDLSGEWVTPDWFAVSNDYDGVYLSVAGYLRAGGLPIEIETGVSSLIAGWNPDTTYWLTNIVQPAGEFISWVIDEDSENLDWCRAQHHPS